jgi:antitoxin component HigA of HigAB toxin-antitoxin module
MKKLTPYQYEKYRALDNPIQDEVHHEQALRAVRKLRGRITEENPEPEMPAEVVALRNALFQRVAEYEKKEYPYGQPGFGEWSNNLTDEDHQQKVERIEQAEKLVDELEAFEHRRTARIREMLRARGQKQQYLVEILRKDKAYVSNLLGGRYPFTLEVVARLHDLLGIPFEDLVPPSAAFEAVPALARTKPLYAAPEGEAFTSVSGRYVTASGRMTPAKSSYSPKTGTAPKATASKPTASKPTSPRKRKV